MEMHQSEEMLTVTPLIGHPLFLAITYLSRFKVSWSNCLASSSYATVEIGFIKDFSICGENQSSKRDCCCLITEGACF